MRLFALTAFLGAALVFAVQPMLAAFVLPWFGGSPAVWTTSLLFFQALLLAGYAYAHGVARLGRRGVHLHLTLLALSLLTLPITPGAAWRPPDPTAPTARLLALLAASVGLPYLLLSATAPLLQARWAAASTRSPYPLYAWSNAGSLLALAVFPLAIAPALGALHQTHGWSLAYAAFALLLGGALWTTRHHAPAAPATGGPAPTRFDRLAWVGFSACGTALLMSVSDAITQDLSVTPLFWVVPLLLYLATFVICFGRPQLASRAVFGPLLVIALGALAWVLHEGWRAAWWAQLGTYCGGLFAGCMLCHGELVRHRPGPAHLTAFYLWISAGGALGGLFVAVLAPLLFPMHLELHVALLGTWALFGAVLLRAVRARPFARTGATRAAVLTLGALLAAALGHHAWGRLRGDTELHRSFFGTLQVKRYVLPKSGRTVVHLLDGRISHGYQIEGDPRPTAYFVPESGIGQVLSRPGPPRRVGIVGLGVGTLAAYGRPGDTFRFYELNPDVAAVARAHFTFLAESAAVVDVVLGDGRLAIAREVDEPPLAVLALDAFSGDAIPTHLITREAIALYLERLAPDGILAVNVSNRHADLTRVVRAHAARFSLNLAWIRAEASSPLGPYRSDWMLLSRAPLPVEGDPPGEGAPVEWTDDHAPVLTLLR